MRQTVKITLAAICAFMLTSCMQLTSDFMDSVPFGSYPGCVRDTDGNPIEHIKVTISTPDDNQTRYTDSGGIFYMDIIGNPVNYTITLTFEDIDGEENGGLFETLTDTITLFGGNDLNSSAMLDYRLNRATASESNPQS